MLIFKKPLTDPEVIAHLKKEGSTLIQVQTTQYYLIEHPVDMPLEKLAEEWFVKFRGSSHAFRDGSHVGGAADTVTIARVLTEDGRVILGAEPTTCCCDCLPCQSCDHK